MADASGRSLHDNPFFVLGMSPERSRAEIEREGAKLLGMLELGLRSAQTYETPVGAGTRTAESVRAALAELRDPERRLLHELWASAPPTAPATAKAGEEGSGTGAEEQAPAGDPYRAPAQEKDAPAPQPGFADAFALFGWGRL